MSMKGEDGVIDTAAEVKEESPVVAPKESNKKGGNSSSSSKKTTKKRKRTAEEAFEEERAVRQEQLETIASTKIRRAAKICKSFVCQKEVRKLKAASSTKQKENVERQLEWARALDLQQVVTTGLKRLGIFNLNPHYIHRTSTSTTDSTNEKEASSSCDETPKKNMPQEFEKQLVETILAHTRMASVMDELNGKATDHRRWMLRRQDSFQNPQQHNKKKKKGLTIHNVKTAPDQWSRGKPNNNNTMAQEYTSNLFLSSLSGGVEEEGASVNPYGPGAEMVDEFGDPFVAQKKNRQGQRARRAKAMAIEAKKAGRVWDSSLNWREKKENPNPNPKRHKSHHSEAEAPPKPSAAEAAISAHPSWAAKHSQQAKEKSGLGIVQFTGTKIKFDD